ncbi:uncharacterized protein LOC143729467 isoform X2 [Siphateles boraxobius]|uniref:uncharacterized protein LOC143729467 isoform X2 n=1 Tax=Siphateles boraxobius TaxID=180520 RepID=UPI00406290F0
MMEQDESIDFKTLKARFQGENGLKIQTKPAVPEKPKTIPPLTKASNPLISSINAAVQKGTFYAPRVVFKDDKNLTRQLSPPWGLKTRENQPINNAEQLEIIQKKEVNTVKQNLKDTNLPLVLPVGPKNAETPESESSPLTPVSVSALKVSTPKKFVFTPQKTSEEKTDHVKEVHITKKSLKDRNLPLVLPVAPEKSETPEPESSPLTPESIASENVSTPNHFVFTTQKTSKDENEKPDTKEVEIVKKSLKERNLPLVLPVATIKADTPEPESSPYTPVSISPVKVSTSRNFVFTPQKTSKDENEKADTAKEVDIAKKSLKDRNPPLVLPLATIKADTPEPESSPYTSVSISPVKVSAPKNFEFTTQKTSKDENEKTDTVESPTPASRTPAPSHSAPAGPSVPASPPMESVPVVPSQTSAGTPPVPNIPTPSIPAPGIPTSASPESKIPEPAIPTPIIPSQAVPKSKSSKPDTTISTPSDPEPLKPNINMLSLSEVFPPPEGSPPPDFTDIPPPVLYGDFPDGDLTEQAIPTPVIRTFINPVPRSPVVPRLASPAPSTPTMISTEPLVMPLEYTHGPDSRLIVSSPPPYVHTPAAPVEVVLENAKALTHNTAINPERTNEDQFSAKTLSALARAQEMASVKRTPNDSRIFSLLERAKRKSTVSQLATTTENITPIETVPPEIPLPETLTPLPETVTTEVTQPKLDTPEKASPQFATSVEQLPEKAPPVPEGFEIPELPPVDYVDHTWVPPKTHPPETDKVDGLDHRMVTVVKNVNPPPPPPRKALPAIPTVDPPLEKPTQSPARYLQIPTTQFEPLETQDSLHDNSSGDVFYEDVEGPLAPAVSTFRPPSIPSSDSSSRRPVSVHEEAFLKQLSPNHQVQESASLNTWDRDIVDVDYGSVNSGSPNPDTQAAVPQDSIPSSPTLSPSGTLERVHNVNEDQANSKKGKTIKNKKQKGPLKNPYDDSAAVEASPKRLFSRKNSGKVSDEKELKKKEKQREKEKEKEKEREKKEQKEKEKKENEMRKKFKITGQEEAMYHVKVIEDCKGRKNDLPVKVGDTVSIIRTNNCPKGKWLAKDSNNKYGYVPVESMDMNINGIMELGKMTTASNRSNGNGHKNTEDISTNSRTSEHYDMNHESFSEDSEEWTGDDDDPVFGSPNETSHIGLNQSLATPAQGPVQPTQTDSTYMNVQPKQEALQRLSTFFMTPSRLLPQDSNPITPEPVAADEEDPGSLNQEEENVNVSELLILPPPDQYADIVAGDSMTIYSKPIKLVSK